MGPITAKFVSLFRATGVGLKSPKEKTMKLAVGLATLLLAASAQAACPYDPACLDNPYGAGSPYKADGVNNPYSVYGSPYSNQSAKNPYATDAPKLYDSTGQYKGRLSTNPYHPESTSNRHGQYGNRFSPDSINNPYANPGPIYVVPQ